MSVYQLHTELMREQEREREERRRKVRDIIIAIVVSVLWMTVCYGIGTTV